MPKQQWFDLLEKAWGADWKRVGNALVSAAGLIRNSCRYYLVAVVALFLVDLPWISLFSHEDAGKLWFSPLVSGLTMLELAVTFCVAVQLFHVASSHLSGREPELHSGFWERFCKALPYGVGMHLVSEIAYGFMLPVFMLLNMTVFKGEPAWLSHAGWVAERFVAMLPMLYLLCRLGPAMVAAAVGDDCTPKEAWAMSKGGIRLLMYTACVWFFFRYGVPAIKNAVIIHWVSSSMVFEVLTWLMRLYGAMVTTFFAVVVSVWYKTLTRQG